MKPIGMLSREMVERTVGVLPLDMVMPLLSMVRYGGLRREWRGGRTRWERWHRDLCGGTGLG